MIFIFFTILFGGAALVGACLIIYARWNYGTLESIGIPVMEPTFFLGSVPDLHLKVQTDEDISRYLKFGTIWGVTDRLYIFISSFFM